MEGQNEVRMEATPVASLQTLEKQFMAQLQHKATETWNYPGSILPSMTHQHSARSACKSSFRRIVGMKPHPVVQQNGWEKVYRCIP